MKKIIWFIFSLLLISFYSCEDEEETVVQNTADSFTKATTISSLVKRVSQNETTCDNVLDNTSLFSVKLPVTVTVDGHNEIVTSSADFLEIQSIKNEHTYDNDIVYFTFPITVIYPDFSVATIHNQNEFNAMASGNDDNFHEIDCIDFQFPFTINIYDVENQVANTVSLATNSQLYNFIDDLEDAEIVGIVYPITLKKTNGQIYTINSNTELEDTIDAAVDENISGSNIPELHEVLTNGSWHISYCYYDNDETSYFDGYDFTFNGFGNEGNVLAEKSSTTITGDWQIEFNNTYQTLKLQFDDNNSLHDLESEWKVKEYTSTYIRLKREGSSNEYYYLSFTKN
jgi:hypothetical protein